MKIFISWSGEKSRALAELLDDWLPRIIPGVKPFYSSRIKPGAMWPNEIKRALKNSQYGIICITPENQNEPWLLFEAGALWLNRISDMPIAPLLFGFDQESQLDLPLGFFQTRHFDANGIKELCIDIYDKFEKRPDFDRVNRNLKALLPSILEEAGNILKTPKTEKLPKKSGETFEGIESLILAMGQALNMANHHDLGYFIKNYLKEKTPRKKDKRIQLILHNLKTLSPEELLDYLLYKKDIQGLCRGAGLPVTGTKDNLIKQWLKKVSR